MEQKARQFNELDFRDTFESETNLECRKADEYTFEEWLMWQYTDLFEQFRFLYQEIQESIEQVSKAYKRENCHTQSQARQKKKAAKEGYTVCFSFS